MQIYGRVPTLNSPNYIEAGSQAQAVDDLVQKLLEWFCLFCAIVLLIVWPLSDTIAARNSALALGCLASLWWMYRAKPKLSFQMLLPILCLLAVPVWLWIHYFFLPTDTEAQLYDLKGTWLRVILAVVMASGLGLMIVKRPERIYWIWFAMTVLGVVSLANFALEALMAHQWVINDYRFPFKYKSAVVYFLMYPCLFAYAIVHSFLLKNVSNNQRIYQNISFTALAILVIVICWLDFINAHALNGILVAGFLGVGLIFGYFISSLYSKKKNNPTSWFLLGTLSLLLIGAISIYWQYDQRHDKKLTNLIGDARIASQIDKYSAWHTDSRYQPQYPVDYTGRTVSISTYERTAWFIKGVEVLYKNPLGAGFSHLGFAYFMKKENLYSLLTKTHSGWLDFALGVGLPGLGLTWISMFLVIWRCLKKVRAKAFVDGFSYFSGIWVLGGIWVLWWPTEVSEREFIEQLFFIIAVFAASNIFNHTKFPSSPP